MQLSIITPIFNRLELTRACIESLPPTLARWKYEWLLIDDGSTDGTREYLQTLPGDGKPFRLLFNETPRGFAANNNLGAQRARAPLLCLLNNDTVLQPSWLEPMARLARLLPDIGFVGNVQREPISGLVDHAGMYFDRGGVAHHFGKDQPAPPSEDYLEWPAVTAACCVIRKKTFLDLGGFDEAYRNGSEDIDFCLRAVTKGYRHYVANRSVIYHHISASPGRTKHEGENQRVFLERWLPRLHGDLGRRRMLETERGAGWRDLRGVILQPWRLNFWRLSRAVERLLSPRLPSARLDFAPRVWLGIGRFFRERWEVHETAPATPTGDPSVYLVVGDTARTGDRSGIPSFVRGLAGAFGRTVANVRLVAWRDVSQSLCLLPAEFSLGSDAEALRPPVVADEKSAPAIVDPAVGQPGDPLATVPALHEPTAADARGDRGWIVLPEVLYRGRAEEWFRYVREHGWRAATVLHDVMPTNEPRFFPLAVPHAHEEYLRALSAADLILPVSQSVAGDFERFLQAKQLPVPAMAVCAPGIDTCARTRTTTPAPASEPGAPVRILCVSSVEPRKNQRALLAAFDLAVERRPDLKLALTLVGEPRLFNEDNVPDAVRAAEARHGDRVQWHERVEYSALAALYGCCDFTVFPSLLEGFPLPIYESLWFRRPCICANFGSMNDAAAGGGCITLDVTNPEVLAEAIIALADSPKRRDWLGEEIDSRPLRTWEDYARDLLAVLPKANPVRP